jgi:hypothetical protein
VVALSKYYPSICLEGLRKTTENSRITGVPGEIQTGKLQNTNISFNNILTQSDRRRGKRTFKILHGDFDLDDA